MSEIQPAPVAELSAAQFTAERLALLWQASYRFSQGSQNVQHDIIRGVVSRYGHAFEQEVVEQSFVLVRPMVIRRAKGTTHIDVESESHGFKVPTHFESDINNNVNKAVTLSMAVLNKGFKLKPCTVAAVLAGRDHGYWHTNDQELRPGRQRKYGNLPNETSYFMRYVVAGHDTKLWEYNGLFADTGAAYRRALPRETQLDLNKLKWVVKRHLGVFTEEIPKAQEYFADSPLEATVEEAAHGS